MIKAMFYISQLTSNKTHRALYTVGVCLCVKFTCGYFVSVDIIRLWTPTCSEQTLVYGVGFQFVPTNGSKSAVLAIVCSATVFPELPFLTVILAYNSTSVPLFTYPDVINTYRDGGNSETNDLAIDQYCRYFQTNYVTILLRVYITLFVGIGKENTEMC